MLQQDGVQTLTDLGLTPREARVFFALTNYRASTANTAAKASNLPRQDIYKVLFGLQQRGLIEKQICTPTKFSAISLEDAFTVLLNHRIEKTSSIAAKTKAILNNLKKTRPGATQDEESKLLLIPEGAAFVARIQKSGEKAKTSIDVILPRNAEQGPFHLADEFQKAIKRNVKIRFMIDNTEPVGPLPETILSFMRNPSFQLRIVLNHASTRFCVYDNREVAVVVSPKTLSGLDFSKASLFWSDCACIVETYQELYDTLWRSANEPGP